MRATRDPHCRHPSSSAESSAKVTRESCPANVTAISARSETSASIGAEAPHPREGYVDSRHADWPRHVVLFPALPMAAGKRHAPGPGFSMKLHRHSSITRWRSSMNPRPMLELRRQAGRGTDGVAEWAISRAICLDAACFHAHDVNVSYIHMRVAMSGSANHGAYGNPGAQNPPWGPGSGWGQPGWDHWRVRHNAKPLWIAAMVLAFIFWWPIGLALLFFGLWSNRVGFWGCGSRYGAWQGGWQRNGWQQQGDGGRPRRGRHGKVFGAVATGRPRPAAIMPSTNIALRPCAGWKTSRRSSPASSTGCASPRTRPSSTSS